MIRNYQKQFKVAFSISLSTLIRALIESIDDRCRCVFVLFRRKMLLRKYRQIACQNNFIWTVHLDYHYFVRNLLFDFFVAAMRRSSRYHTSTNYREGKLF